jgi:hypothetical protein
LLNCGKSSQTTATVTQTLNATAYLSPLFDVSGAMCGGPATLTRIDESIIALDIRYTTVLTSEGLNESSGRGRFVAVWTRKEKRKEEKES